MRRRRGMTLLEVTIAMALLAMLSVFVIQVINSVTDLWSSGERRGRGDLVFAEAVERLRADLAALHRGPRGWLILDSYEAAPEEEAKAAWWLPRLRFLADGAGLREYDPSGRGGVELMWVVEPEGNPASSRLTRLVRYGRAEGVGLGLRDNGSARSLQRQGEGMVIMDGLLWLEFAAADPIRDGAFQEQIRIEPDSPADFPSRLRLHLERVSGTLRERPPRLDREISAEGNELLLRGSAPLEQPPYALIEQEWVQLGGRFPRLTMPQRGLRDSQPAAHAATTPVWMPEIHEAEQALPGGGRRQQ